VKLHRAGPTPYNLITEYGEGYIAINGQRTESSVIVTRDQVLPWQATSFEKLAAADLEVLSALGPEIVLLGTGPRQRFPHPRLTAPLVKARIGVEIMDLKAACRTYNILVVEERKVIAALLFE
jgi:uncharacterized protein